MADQFPPMIPSAVMPDPRKADDDHLKLLAVFHFVFAGLVLLGLAFLGAHYAIMSTVLDPDFVVHQKNANPPPEELFDMLLWFYLIGAMMITAQGVANLISGFYLRKKKHRIFSMIVAGVNCLQFPIGTTLGVFTFIVLVRDSVREAYGD